MQSAVEFDFTERACRSIPPEDVKRALGERKACWVDIDIKDDVPKATLLLKGYGFDDLVIEKVLTRDITSLYVMHDSCLHVCFPVVASRDGKLHFSRLDLILAEDLLISLHRGTPHEVEQVHKIYLGDFKRHAQSIGFMLYEFFDQLCDSYRRAIRATQSEVEHFQGRIYGDMDDQIFTHVAHANKNLLSLRTSLIHVRDILHQLATRKSVHVSGTTQPFLENILGTIDRLTDDLNIARDILSESLSLYMSIVGHRTNKVLTRLTIASLIFWPLSIITSGWSLTVGLRNAPQLEWRDGYALLWGVLVATSIALLLEMRRRKWI
jgi:magnesium transporter